MGNVDTVLLKERDCSALSIAELLLELDGVQWPLLIPNLTSPNRGVSKEVFLFLLRRASRRGEDDSDVAWHTTIAEFVQRITADFEMLGDKSFAEAYSTVSSDAVGPAEAFISYSRENPCLFISEIFDDFSLQSMWIDILSFSEANNLMRAEEIKQVIVKAGSTYLLLDESGKALDELKVLWECLVSVRNKVPITTVFKLVTRPPAGFYEPVLIAILQACAAAGRFDSLDIITAKASNKDDKEHIHSLIKKEVGLEGANSILRTALRESAFHAMRDFRVNSEIERLDPERLVKRIDEIGIKKLINSFGDLNYKSGDLKVLHDELGQENYKLWDVFSVIQYKSTKTLERLEKELSCPNYNDTMDWARTLNLEVASLEGHYAMSLRVSEKENSPKVSSEMRNIIMDLDRTKDLIELEDTEPGKAKAFRKLFLNVLAVLITEEEHWSYQQGMNMILGKLLMAQPLCEATALFSAMCGWLIPRPWFHKEELRDYQMDILPKALSVFDKKLAACLAANKDIMMVIVPTKWNSLFTEYDGINVYKLWSFVFKHGDLDYFYIILLADLLVNSDKVLQMASKGTSKVAVEAHESIRFYTDAEAVVQKAHDISLDLPSKRIWPLLISCGISRMGYGDGYSTSHFPPSTEHFSSPRSLPQRCCVIS